MCRPMHRPLMRNELLDLTTIVPATACHQRDCVETYSRFMPPCLYLQILEERQAVHKTFEIPLDIPDVTIEKAETNRHGDFVITVKSTIEGTYCHTCGKKITKVYGYDREITCRHLSILGKKTFIRLRPVRYQCPSCEGNPTTTQPLSWYNPRSSYTKSYEEHRL